MEVSVRWEGDKSEERGKAKNGRRKNRKEKINDMERAERRGNKQIKKERERERVREKERERKYSII